MTDAATDTLPRIALTPGEPAGIGPDLALALAADDLEADLVAVADPALLAQRSRDVGAAVDIETINGDAGHRRHEPGTLRVLPVTLTAACRAGEPTPENAAYVLETLRLAGSGCLAGDFDAMVTAPVNKGVINDAGVAFSGHTEYLAELTGAAMPVMMLAAGSLRVALATTHLPLRRVSDALTAERLEQVARILHAELRQRFAIDAPRVLVCGLNPHAGEDGHLGDEEITTINPTLDRLRAEGMDFVGPLPADTLFVPGNLAGADAVLAMYHDQGLPVLKHAGFGRAVNITLGLPIIRTSVDHGTALDLAGSGRADPGSLRAALAAALDLVRRSRQARQ